jgi:hypothetical protein
LTANTVNIQRSEDLNDTAVGASLKSFNLICFNFSNLDEATHCFVELNKTSLPVDLSVLVKKRIPCVAPMYLNDYLINTPPPQAHNCVIPEYKCLLEGL